MQMLRQHETLTEILQKELTGVPNPRQTAAAILESIDCAESLVLFRDRAGNWEIRPTGPAHPLKNIGQAARAVFAGKTPVAFCRVNLIRPARPR